MKRQPPRWADRLLEWFVAPHLLEYIQGDLQELFRKRLQEVSLSQARREYAWAVLHCLTPFFRKSFQERDQPFTQYPKPTPTTMLTNYVKLAWRGLLTSKVYSLINIGGLSMALAIGILLLWWVKGELSYDQSLTKADQIYRVNASAGGNNSDQFLAHTVAPIAPVAKQQVPGVIEAVRISPNNSLSPFKVNGKNLFEDRAAYVDPAFFSFFELQWLKGNPNQPFQGDQSVVLTESAARKYFGSANPMGKSLYSIPTKQTFVVSGLIHDFLQRSTVNYSVLLPIKLIANQYKAQPSDYWKSMDSDWGNWYTQTYLAVHPRANLAMIAQQLSAVHHAHNQFDQTATYRLQPLRDIHLYQPSGAPGLMQEVRMMGMVALILLAIGCINYVNLATARASQRAKEVSVRKVVGAGRRQLMGQFLAESALIFVIALALATLLMKLLEPTYQQLTGQAQPFSLTDPQVWLVLLGALGFTLAMAGIYPALVLSSFDPLTVLRGKPKTGQQGLSFRQTLVVTQFAFSTALIVGTLVIGTQLRFLSERNLGYDRQNTLAFWMTGEMANHYEAVKAELMQQPGVSAVTSANQDLVNIGSATGDTDWDGKKPHSMFIVKPMRVEKDFIQTFHLQLASGESFSGSKADSTHFILNETAVRQAGIRNPIGKRFKLWQTEGTIIGVLKDFHLASMKAKIEPAAFYYQPHNPYGRIYIKIAGRDVAQVIAYAQQLWKKYSPDYPFDYQFMDDQVNEMYSSEQRTGLLFTVFAGIAILVSCLGLFGLATFTAQRRRKEIGVRKVLGASVLGIVTLLSRDFLKLVLLGILIASPIAWYTMSQWLEEFAYRTTLSWWLFGVAGFVAIGIALLTVSYQALQAALVNPVKSLRSE